jgi:phosphatidylinositol alpha-1,6-mannosyltransferase
MSGAADDARRPRRWWFVVRKYPPAVGGMELLSYNVVSRLSARHPVTVVPMRARAWMLPWFLVSSAARVTIACLRGDIALLHVGDPVLAPLALIARLFGIPCSVTLHGLDVVYERGVYPLWRRVFLRGFDAYIAISEATRDAALRIHIPADRIHVIGIGIDVPREVAHSTTRDTSIILFVGRLVRRKGLGWFVAEVLPVLATRYADLKLVVLGDGPERAAIAEMAISRNVGDRIVWLGKRSDAEKATWFAKAGVCVMPNIVVHGDMEGFGIVALEAAAAGCPVVAADLEGLRDAVTDGESGALVRSGDAKQWVAALTPYLCDGATNVEIGNRARRYVQAHRSWDTVIDAYERVLQGILQSRGNRAR